MKKRLVTYIVAAAAVIVIVLLSYRQPPISYMGGGPTASQTTSQSKSSLVIMAPTGVLPSGVDASISKKVGKQAEILPLTDEQIVDRVSRGTATDIVMFRNDFAQRLYERGLIQPLDLSEVQNTTDKYLKLPFASWGGYRTGSGPSYSVPYLVRTEGILFKSPEKQSEPVSWSILWTEAQSGKIGLPSLDELVYITAISEKFNLSDLSEKTADALKTLSPKVEQLSRYVKTYQSDREMLADLAEGALDAAVVSQTDAAKFVASHPGFQFSLPSEGAIAWVYAFCVPARVSDPDNSYRMINSFLEPTYAASLYAKDSGLILVPDLASKLDEGLRTQFETDLSQFDSSIIIPNLSDEAQRTLDSFLESIKQGGS